MNSSNLLRILSILVLLCMRGIAFAIDPSGVRVNENPHPPFEVFIPITILIVFIVGFLFLKIGAMIQQSNQKENNAPQYLTKKRETTTISRCSEVKDNYPPKTENANNIYQLAEFAYSEWLKEGYYGNYIKAVNLYKQAAEKGHLEAKRKYEWHIMDERRRKNAEIERKIKATRIRICTIPTDKNV